MIGNIPERANLRRRGSVTPFAVESLIVILLLSSLFGIELTHSVNPSSEIHSSGWIGLDWLHSEGKFIKDSEGNVVVLRGANFMGYEFGAWNSHKEEDYAKMASMGFNVVRLPIAWHYFEPQPGIYNLSYLEDYVDRDIRWAEKYGLYIILDMHQWYWSPHFTFFSKEGERGNGFPAWLVNGYQDSPEGYSKAITDFWLGKGANGTLTSLDNPSMQDRLISIWTKIARKYSDKSTIAGYDLLNEPYRGELSREEHANYLYQFYEKLINRIRDVDSRHIIIYQHTATYSAQNARAMGFQNIVFSFHFYRLRETYDCNKTRLEELFCLHYYYTTNWSIPVFIGEFNTHASYPNATQWILDVIDMFKRYDVGWAWWTYYRSDYYSAALCYANGDERIELPR